MGRRTRTTFGLVLVALAAACGAVDGVDVEAADGAATGDAAAGGAATDGAATDGPAGAVLSACEPPGGQQTTTLVDVGDERPPIALMEDALAGNPDAAFVIEQRQADGATYEDALHEMYAQTVGEHLFTDAHELPGFVTGSYARPEVGEPFRLSFSGPVPEAFDPGVYDLGSFGLAVTTDAVGFDDEAFAAAFDAARTVGMRPVSGSGDETTGTGRIEVIDATPEQVTAWEAAVDDPSRWCLVRAPRTVPCDDGVIEEARGHADRQGAVLPNDQGDAAPTAAYAEQVRRSYLGLTLAEAEDKAAREDRAVRVTVQEGVELGSEDDLQPGRLSLTVCRGIVVDTVMDLEPRT